MNRLYKFVGCLCVLLLLAGCTGPYSGLNQTPDLDLDPYPYSFTNADKHPYPRTLAGARRFIAEATDDGPYDSYPHWAYTENTYVQAPAVSERLRSGDCDDYAVMMAYYLQEYWGFDTFIVILDMGHGNAAHMVCFVQSGVVSIGYCPKCPCLSLQDDTYYPVDWQPCPWWTWACYGGSVDFLDMGSNGTYYVDTHTGRRVLIGTGQDVEWYEMVNLPLDETSALPDSTPAECSNVDN